MRVHGRLKRMLVLVCACLCISLLPGCSRVGERADSTEAAGGVERENGGAQQEDGGVESAKGRFLETEIALPEKISNVLGVKCCEDGSVVLVGYDENYVGLYRECLKNEGGDWEETALNSGNFFIAAIDGMGEAALIGYPSEGDFSITLASADGSERKLSIEIPEYKGGTDSVNFILDAGYAAGKLFVVDLNHMMYEVDMESGALSPCTKITESVSGVIPLGDRLAVLTRNGVRLWDAGQGELLPEDPGLSEAVGVLENHSDTPVYPVMLAAGGKEGELYYVSHGGIFFHREGASTSEQLANGELISVGDGSMNFRGLVRFDDEHFMVFAVDSLGNERCYSYAYDENASAVPEKQLNVYALEDSIILQQAISVFQKNNPDVFVKKRIGMSGDNGVTAEDAIKTLNTEIMAGNGPDVLVLDGLPVESYIEKGVLSDISGTVGAVEKEEGLFTNITDAYRKDGALYQVPLRFFCTAAEWDGGQDAPAGAPEELAEYAKRLQDGDTPVLSNFPAEMILYAFYDAYSPLWKTEEGMDAQALRDSLEALKTLYELDGYTENERYSYGAVYSDSIYQNQIIFGTLNSGASDRLTGRARMGIGTLCGVSRVRDLYGVESVAPGSFGLLYAGEQRVFGGAVCLGVAESAKENETACAFVRSALSAEGQRLMTNYFPVNRTAYESECDVDQAYSIGGSDENGVMFGYEVVPLNEEQKKSLTGMLESLNTPMWSDRVVEELFISEGRRYLQGEQSLEDAVAAITRKVQLRVSE
ncbi:MAG: extracellular solute-binding protein [Muribaculaceae bacterium]|nr:extracellular solute-binding protein [Roseburia sp.]MCM1431431.1 extracellular solute-binding protein [Muribaculaceae bacterium]MCM1491873.1 extracellular solute-binding protein [Muribaculaceae bacterium]